MMQEIKYKDHEEWLAIRNRYIGGSDAGAVVGMNPYRSRYSLWAEKTGKVEGFAGNLTTRVGAYLEDLVASLFEEETGKKVRRKKVTMVNPVYPFACANVDRVVVGERSLLEIKTTNSLPLMKKLRNSDEFPEEYYAQCVHYLAVTGYERIYLAVLINCRELKIYTLERDQGEIYALMTEEMRFWELVETDTPPAPDGSDATGETLTVLYPESSADEVDLFGFERDLTEYTRLSGQIKALTALKNEAANKVKAFMQDAGRGKCGPFSVSWVSSSRTTFDADRFATDHPDMDLSEYYKQTPNRTFRVFEKKGE